MGVHWGGISNRAVTETLLRMEQNSECRAHVVKQRCGGIGVHLWRSPPEWKPRCIWERGEYTIRRHNPDYPFRSVSWRPPSKTRRRSHSAVTMETTRGNGPWNFHAELFSFFFSFLVSKSMASVEGNPPLAHQTADSSGWQEASGTFFLRLHLRVRLSYLMDDLRHWQLVHVRVRLLLRLFIHRAGRQRHTKLRLWKKTTTTTETFLTGEKRYYLES